MGRGLSSKTVSIQELLASSEHPHKWMIQNNQLESTDIIMENLLIENSLSEIEFPFDCLMSHISLAYKHFRSNEVHKAFKYLKRGEDKFEQLQANENVHKWRNAFIHILKATELFILESKGDTSQILQVASLIPKIMDMDIPNRTAVQYGLPALVIGNFGLDGKRLALSLLSKAIQNDPNESVWYYVRAVFIGEVECANRVVGKMPTTEEFRLLNEALRIKRTALYTSHFAGLYRQSAKELSRPVRVLAGPSKDQRKIQELNEKSAELYNESLELNSCCPEVLLRCARGFLFLPAPWQDKVRTSSLLDRVCTISPNSSFFNLVMAEYYKMNQDPEKALHYFKECEKKRLYGPTMACIRLQYQLHHNINFIERLENLLSIYPQDLDKLNILFELATYSLEVLKNLTKTCHYVEKIMLFGNKGDFILQCRPSGAFCSTGFHRTPFYNLFVDKLKNIEGMIMPEEEKEYLDKFLQKLLLRKVNCVDTKSNWRSSKPHTPILSWRRQSMGPATAITRR